MREQSHLICSVNLFPKLLQLQLPNTYKLLARKMDQQILHPASEVRDKSFAVGTLLLGYFGPGQGRRLWGDGRALKENKLFEIP